MKFSYPLIKKIIPKLPSKTHIVRALTMHVCEAANMGGNVFDVSLPPNRYADMASHFGVAREVAAALKLPLKLSKFVFDTPAGRNEKSLRHFSVQVRDRALCPRYSARMVTGVTITSSPKWMQETLIDCGVRPINNIVDVMNYVMLETGQPLHAFDAQKLAPRGKPTIIVRRAKQGEHITTIDGVRYALPPGALVIADAKRPLAIAGIKGGLGSEVTAETQDIIVESANFDPVSIYKTSRALSLVTDASIRFSHGLHGALTYLALARATALLQRYANGKSADFYDSRTKPFPKHTFLISREKFAAFLGTDIKEPFLVDCLTRLGFEVRKRGKGRLHIVVPPLRLDITTHEDVAEEVARCIGYQKLRPIPPRVALTPATQDGIITLRERAGKIVSGFGMDEIKTHSFVAQDAAVPRTRVLELHNPPSDAFRYLRTSLIPGLLRSFEHNRRFFDEVRLYEIGNVFSKKSERVHTEHASLGVLIAAHDRTALFTLKGMAGALMQALGVRNVTFVSATKDADIPQHESFLGAGFLEKPSRIVIRAGNIPLGFLGLSANRNRIAACLELNLSLVLHEMEEKQAFSSLPRYPAVVRDISMLVSRSVRIGDVLQEISLASKKLIEDVDLIDEYVDEKWNGKQSLSFRIVFQASNRTLTSEEVDVVMGKIAMLLQKKFSATIR